MKTVLSLSGLVVAPFRAPGILAPALRWAPRIVSSPWIAVPNLLLYAVLALPKAGSSAPAFGSTAGSAAVFGTPEGSVIV